MLSDQALGRLRDVVDAPALPARYRPIEVLGRGGMGVVWRARDAELERDVAVKVVAPQLAGDGFAERLRAEARILARLEHPGIVAVHDAGTAEDGSAWYVMRLVHGTRLDEAVRAAASRGELLRLVERLCETVAYAHAAGVVHRDLTPGNVMVGPFGEVLVLDWGVARERDASDAGGLVVGTPGFMAPEQAAGIPGDARTDVYGLGAILRALCAVHPVPVPPALGSIVARATAADPAARYESALALRDDLRRFLDGARVLAHRERPLETLARLASTYRTPILLILAYVVMRLAIFLWRGI